MKFYRDAYDDIGEFLHLAIGFLVILSGVGVFFYEAYLWLKYGEWAGVSLLNLLAWLSDCGEPSGDNFLRWIELHKSGCLWVYHPQSWIGPHKLLDFVDLTLFLIVLGGFIMTVGWGDP